MSDTITIYRSQEGAPFIVQDDDLGLKERGGDTASGRITGTARCQNGIDIHYDLLLQPGDMHIGLTTIERSTHEFCPDQRVKIRIDGVTYDLTTSVEGEAGVRVSEKSANLAIWYEDIEVVTLHFVDLTEDSLVQIYIENVGERWQLAIPDAALYVPFDGTTEGLELAISGLPETTVELERGRTLKFRDFAKKARKLGVDISLLGGKHSYKLMVGNGKRIPLPFHGKNEEIKPGTLRGIAKQIGVSLDELLEA